MDGKEGEKDGKKGKRGKNRLAKGKKRELLKKGTVEKTIVKNRHPAP